MSPPLPKGPGVFPVLPFWRTHTFTPGTASRTTRVPLAVHKAFTARSACKPPSTETREPLRKSTLPPVGRTNNTFEALRQSR